MTDLNLCVLGDGLAKGYGDPKRKGWAGYLADQVAEGHGPLTYYNLGIPGESSAGVLKRVGELDPRLTLGADNRLLLAFGLVDVIGYRDTQPLALKESLANLQALLLKTQGRYKMLMVGPPAVFDPVQNGRVKRLNSAFHDLSLKVRVPYIDLFSSLVEDVQYRRELSQGDRIHPGEKGHVKIFELLSNDRSWWFG